MDTEIIMDYGIKFFAVVGALYGLARAVVAITPTKKDDKWLSENVSPIILKLSQIFGLDLGQGKKVK